MDLNSEHDFDSDLPISTILEISQKVTELLDAMEYSNKQMLITREHIKYNLAQLIKTSSTQLSCNSVKRLNSSRRAKNYNSPNNMFVDNRGNLKFNFS